MSEPLHPASDDRGDQGRKTPARSPTNEARRETQGSRVSVEPDAADRERASIRPGAKRRDHVNRRDHPWAQEVLSSMGPARSAGITRAPGLQRTGKCRCFNEARREAPGSTLRATVPCSRLRTRFNEARRESPGSRVNRRDHPWAQGVLASMRPGAKRRDHGPDTGCPHHKQLSSTLRALAERPRCNT